MTAQVEKKHGAILEAQEVEIQAIKDCLTKLEEHVKAREEILVAEAKGQRQPWALRLRPNMSQISLAA